MGATIDQRIVEMQFDNQRFERNVSTSISTLDKLKEALHLNGAIKGIESVEKSFDKLNFSGIGSAVDVIASRFSSMGIIATTILQDIGHKAFEAGQRILGMIKSMTIDQVSVGWEKYAEKTTSVQTIMAATGQTWKDDADALLQLNALTEKGFDTESASSYLQAWKDVNNGILNVNDAAKQLGITTQEFQNKTQDFSKITSIKFTGSQMEYVNSQMEKLNWFTDETSYNFTDMVNNIGKFTANNIPLSQATTAMQGIANWAAISGQNASTASRAMYNMAQAIGVGSVKLMDWKSIENANMATSEFKQKAIEMAVENGKLTKSVNKLGEEVYKTSDGIEVTAQNFSQTLASGWFSSDVLLDTLGAYGSFTDQLYDFSEASGLTATEILELIDAEKEGSISEAKYKSIMQETGMSLDEVKSVLADLGSEENEFGRKTFQAAQEAKTFSDAIDATKDAASTKWLNIFENIFGDYEKAKVIWTGFANFLYDSLVAPLEKIEEISEAIGEADTVTRLASIFSNLFSVFKGDGVDTFGILDSLSTGFKRVYPPIEDLRLAISKTLIKLGIWSRSIQLSSKSTAHLTLAAQGAANVLKFLQNSISNIWDATEPLRTSLSGLGESFFELVTRVFRVGNYIDTTGIKVDWFRTICLSLSKVVNKVSDAFDNIDLQVLKDRFSKLGVTLGTIRQSLLNIWDATEPLRTSLSGLFDAVVNLVRKLFSAAGGFELTEYKAEGLKKIFDKLAEIIDKVSELLNNIDTDTIKKGFASIASVVSKVKNSFSSFFSYFENFSFSKAIDDAVSWITEKFQALKDFLSKFNIGNALLGGAAIGSGTILGIGIIKLIKLIKNPLKGLDGIKEKIEGLLDSIGELTGLKIDSALEGIKKLAVAILILAAALLVLGFVDYENAIFGIALIAGVLLLFFNNLKVFEKIKASSIIKISGLMIALSASMLVFAIALAVLSGAIALFALVAKMDNVWGGLIVMAASLVILIGAMYLLNELSPKVFISAAALLILSIALIVLAGAIALFALVAKMDTVWTGISLLAISLGILVTALIGLSSMSPMIIIGAASVLVLSAALIVLAGVLAAFALVAGMENAWQGLNLLAVSLGVLIIALLALAPAALGAIGAAAALLLIAGACLVLAVAIGVVSLVLPLLGSGLQALAEGVSGALSSLGVGISDFGDGIGKLLNTILSEIALGVSNIISSTGEGIGAAASSIGTGLGEGISGLGEGVAGFITSISESVSGGLEELGLGVSSFGEGVGKLIEEVLGSIALGVEEIVASVGLGIADGVNAIADSIGNLGDNIGDLGDGITTFGTGLKSLEGIKWTSTSLGIGEIALALKGLSVDGLATTVSDAANGIVTSCTEMVDSIESAVNEADRLTNDAGKRIVNSMASGMKSRISAISSASIAIGLKAISGLVSGSKNAYNIGVNAAQGFIDGFLSKELIAGEAGKRIAKMALKKAKEELDEHSPSKAFFKIGNYGTLGFINGLLSMSNSVEDAGELISKSALSSVADNMAGISELIEENPDFSPIISPVLDSKAVENGLSKLSSIRRSSLFSLNLDADKVGIQNGNDLLNDASSNFKLVQEHDQVSRFSSNDAEELINIGNKIISCIKEGHDVFFDDGEFAGRINRRLVI